MELAFDNEKLREECRVDRRMRAAFGPEGAEIVESAIADLKAAASIYDAADGPISPFGLRGERLRLTFGVNLELEIVANHRTNPVEEDGMVDWHQVHRVKIIELVFS